MLNLEDPRTVLRDLRCEPNRNGNTPASMIKALLSVCSACSDLEEALKGLHTDVVHGRNYQTVARGQTVYAEDRAMLIELQKRVMNMKSWATDQAISIDRWPS